MPGRSGRACGLLAVDAQEPTANSATENSQGRHEALAQRGICELSSPLGIVMTVNYCL